MIKTSDTGFASHLVKRFYPLSGVDNSLPRWQWVFDISEDDFRRERDWYDHRNLGDLIRIHSSLAGVARGRLANETMVARWPGLAVANQALEKEGKA